MEKEPIVNCQHLNIGFDFIETLLSIPDNKVYKKIRKVKIRPRFTPKRKRPLPLNMLCYKLNIRTIEGMLKRPMDFEKAKGLLRNSILPVDQDWKRVVKWLEETKTL